MRNDSNLLLDFANHKNRKDFDSFAARTFPGLPAIVHTATGERPNVADDEEALITAAGVDLLRRDLHSAFNAQVRPISLVLLLAGLVGGWTATAFGLEHVKTVQSVYRDGVAAAKKEEPTARERLMDKSASKADRAEAAVDIAKDKWTAWKEKRKASRDEKYDKARENR